MTKIDWSKAPEGTDKYNTFNKRFYRGKRPQLEVFNEISEEWQSSDLLVQNEHFVQRPDEPYTWNGDGLPPVGTVCEALWNEASDIWFKAKVFGVNEHGQPIHRWEEGPKIYEYQAYPLHGPHGTAYFRPIRTPEQIAAEEREKAIEQMMEDYKYKEGPCTHHLLRSQAERIYDAGYRRISRDN